MKRSLFITIVVLLMAALFVSCNADKAVEDQLFEVTIDGGARALQATAEFNVDIEQYYWFYTATKTSGGFRTGEKTEETAVKTANNAPAKGLAGANLGSFSKGDWSFSFFCYADPADKGTAAKRVFFQTGLNQTVNAAVSLAITLTRGEGALPAATVVFDNPTWYHADFAILPSNQTTGGYPLTLKVFVGDATDPWKTVNATTDAGKATFQFATTDVLTLEAAATLHFRVYWGQDLVGAEDLEIAAAGATKYTVKDLNELSGITPVASETYGVVVFDAAVPGMEATTATGTISVSTQDATVVKANVTPDAPTAGAQTTVTFPAGSFSAAGTHELTIAVDDAAEAADRQYEVQVAGTPLAVLSFNLDNTATTFGAPVEVETYIATGLNVADISIIYNGTGANGTVVSYDSSTGKLVFTVTHFSEYIIVSSAVEARIGGKVYAYFDDAVRALASGDTLTLLKDLDFSTERYAGYKWAGETYNPLEVTQSNVTIDLNGKTISNMGNVGICFGHLLAADGRLENVVIKNGTLSVGQTSGVTNSYALAIAGVSGARIENITTLGGINVYSGSENVVIDNCTVQGTKYYTVCAQTGSKVTIKNSTLTKNTDSSVATKAMFWIQGAGTDSDMKTSTNTTGAFGASSITLESGTYTVDTANGGFFYLTSGLKPTLTGGVYNIDPNACVATGLVAGYDTSAAKWIIVPGSFNSALATDLNSSLDHLKALHNHLPGSSTKQTAAEWGIDDFYVNVLRLEGLSSIDSITIGSQVFTSSELYATSMGNSNQIKDTAFKVTDGYLYVASPILAVETVGATTITVNGISYPVELNTYPTALNISKMEVGMSKTTTEEVVSTNGVYVLDGKLVKNDRVWITIEGEEVSDILLTKKEYVYDGVPSVGYGLTTADETQTGYGIWLYYLGYNVEPGVDEDVDLDYTVYVVGKGVITASFSYSYSE